jgi:hypothetical protein
MADNWRPLKPTAQHRGHLAVCLVRGGRKHTRHVHRIVLEAFVGPYPEGLECCHNDGDPANNRLDNLRWDTHQATMDDMLRNGTRKMGSVANLKLRDGDVREIRRLKSRGVPMDRLAATFGVSRPNIEAIVYRTTLASSALIRYRSRSSASISPWSARLAEDRERSRFVEVSPRPETSPCRSDSTSRISSGPNTFGRPSGAVPGLKSSGPIPACDRHLPNAVGKGESGTIDRARC